MTSSNEIAEAAELLSAGELVVFPTETVYGLGADATSDLAVAKVYEAKGRPAFNPLIVHVAAIDQAFALGQFDATSKLLARTFWPGSLTLVVPRVEKSPVSRLASAGLNTIAIRIPLHPLAHALLAEFGGPVVAPSANMSGRISPTTVQHVLHGLNNRVALILDGGPCAVGVESTVVRVMEDGPYLLRAGGIASADIERVLGRRLMTPTRFDDELHSPGQLESHYAPQAMLRLDAALPDAGEIYIGFGAHAHGPYSLSPAGDVVEAAAKLFRLLHEVDALHPEGIAVAPIPGHGLGEAINDRLRRAAAPRAKP